MAEHIEYQGNFSGSQIDTLLAKIQSSQVFTTEEKTKLASLVNYDDTEVKEDISDIETSLDELTAKEQANENNISTVIMKKVPIASGDLNNVTENSYAIYTDVVSNKPTAETWYIVKTSVYDNNIILQEATALNSNAATYTRIKRSGNWQAWKLSNLNDTQLAAVNSGIDSTKVAQIETNQNNILEAIDNINTELSVPVISSNTSLTDYANTLSRGYHTAFFTSASKLSDAPISDNCFVEIFVYSGSTAIIRVIPTGTAHYTNNYVKTKVSGTWQTGWVVFAGTAQSGI